MRHAIIRQRRLSTQLANHRSVSRVRPVASKLFSSGRSYGISQILRATDQQQESGTVEDALQQTYGGLIGNEDSARAAEAGSGPNLRHIALTSGSSLDSTSDIQPTTKSNIWEEASTKWENTSSSQTVKPAEPKPIPPSPSGSISEVDTPEALTDVAVSSMAPGINWLKDKEDLLTISTSIAIGALVAMSVFIFDVSIESIKDVPEFLEQLGIGGGREAGLQLGSLNVPYRCFMPIVGGVLVASLQAKGFAPPLKGLTRSIEGVVDDQRTAEVPVTYGPVFRKALASAITLGSGASLGPEAPSVELGANTACVIAPKELNKNQLRMLIAAGAAAGVTAAFDAPVAGALFAIEFVLKSSRMGLDRLSTSTVFVATAVAAGMENVLRDQGQSLGIQGAASHLVGRIPYFSVNKTLILDVIQFGALGVGCAGVAVLLYEGVRVSEIALRPLPRKISAPLAGAICGLIAYQFPQVQYGYVNLEEIFRDSSHMSVASLISLLAAKIAATSVCVGGGLVGGLFAPSLFLGALLGDLMGNWVFLEGGVVDSTSYAVVGAAAVLGASCRAPLTAMALMVEITRDTGLLLPLLAAIGMSSLVTDYLEGAFSSRLETLLVEMYLKEKEMFWGAAAAEQLVVQEASSKDIVNTVEKVMGVETNMYARRTLPLEQARSAMMDADTAAAVVVDDNFQVMGVVYLNQVEDEMARQRELISPDSNFNRPS